MLAKIGTFLLDYVVKRVLSWLNALFAQNKKVKEQNEEIQKAADKFQEIVNDPTKTREERKNAEDTFLNS